MHQLLSLKFFISRNHASTTFIKIFQSQLDSYATRETFSMDHTEITECSFVQFVANYYLDKQNCLKQRTKPVVVHTLPNYSSKPKGTQFGLYCKYQLLRYKPCHGTRSNAWNQQEESDMIFIICWDEFLQTTGANNYVPDRGVEMDNICSYNKTSILLKVQICGPVLKFNSE